MAFRGKTSEEVNEVLRECLTPSCEIQTPERLYGRSDQLSEIERAFSSRGRHVFIFGERGVGKTSLAVTAASLSCADYGVQPIYVPCGETTTFADILQAAARKAGRINSVLAKRGAVESLSGGVPGVAGLSVSLNNSAQDIAPPKNINDALAILEYIAEKRPGRPMILIDEFDRIVDQRQRAFFAELIKNASTLQNEVKFLFCGIGEDINSLLGHHESVGRYFVPLELERLCVDDLWKILCNTAKRLGVEIPQETLYRVSIISDGFPHFVHLIGQCLFWSMNDDDRIVSQSNAAHYRSAIAKALRESEPSLRLGYQKATEKTKNQLQYEEALWALADIAETRRQISRIYETSYLRISAARSSDPMERKTLNARLQALRRPNHGSIVVGHGAGWFSFREGVMRGYVRLKAECEGVELVPDPC